LLIARGRAHMGTYLEKHVVGLPELLVDNVQRLEGGRAEVRQGLEQHVGWQSRLGWIAPRAGRTGSAG